MSKDEEASEAPIEEAILDEAEVPTGFSPEQQALLDQIVTTRLKRAQEKWRRESEERSRAEAEGVELQRQADLGEWEKLAKTHETKATELARTNKEMQAQLKRMSEVIEGLIKRRRESLPERLEKMLEGRDVVDQLELIEAFQALQEDLKGNGSERRPERLSALPTPSPQGTRGMTDEERRAKARSTW